MATEEFRRGQSGLAQVLTADFDCRRGTRDLLETPFVANRTLQHTSDRRLSPWDNGGKS